MGNDQDQIVEQEKKIIDWKDLWQEDLKGPKMGFNCV